MTNLNPYKSHLCVHKIEILYLKLALLPLMIIMPKWLWLSKLYYQKPLKNIFSNKRSG